MDAPTQVDANEVIDELTQVIARLHRQLAVVTVQLRTANATPTEVPPPGA